MKRLVLLLMLGLGWVAYRRVAQLDAGRPGAGAYPFPTGESHAAIPAGDDADLSAWCTRFGCSDSDLRAAIGSVGRSVEALRDRLARH